MGSPVAAPGILGESHAPVPLVVVLHHVELDVDLLKVLNLLKVVQESSGVLALP